MLHIIVLAAVTANCSCKKDFLDNQNLTGVLFREDYVVNLITTGEYLNGVYSTLSRGIFDGANTIYPDLVADNIKPIEGALGTTPMQFQYNWEQQADISQTLAFTAQNNNGLSYGCYSVIRTSNFVITAAEKYRSEDPTKADDIKGQALALRAYAEFTLLNVFAQPYGYTSDASHPGIILIDSWNWTNDVPARSTVYDCYQRITGDLTNAMTIIGASKGSSYFFNKTSVKALLARIYLFKGEFEKATQFAVEVTKSVPLQTTGYPEKLFTLEGTESILQLPPAGSDNKYYTNYASLYFRSNKLFNATNDIAELLKEDPSDKRNSWISGTSNAWTITKYPSNVVAGMLYPDQSYLQPVIRSSEMYLTAAEAYYQLNNRDSAVYYLDAVRMRANEQATPTIASGSELQELIYSERRKELAFEGIRMFDLLRWKKGIVRKDALNSTSSELPYPSNKAISPIPSLDVDAYRLTQNPEY